MPRSSSYRTRRPGGPEPARLHHRARARDDLTRRSAISIRRASSRRAGQLDEALREYRRASEFDPPNRQVAAKVTEMERRIRDQAEAAQPKSNLAQLRETARQTGPPPLFNLTTVLPGIRFTNASLRDILGSIGMSAGINVTFDNTFQDRAVLGPDGQLHARGSAGADHGRQPAVLQGRRRRAASWSSPTTSRSAGSTRSRSSARSSSRTPTPPNWRSS